MDTCSDELRVDFAAASEAEGFLKLAPRLPILRRALYFTIVAVTVLLAVTMLTEILAANGLEVVEVFILVVFFVNFVLIALSFWTAVTGFVVRAMKRDPINLRPVAELRTAASGSITTRTAVTIPVYNEDPRRVFAGLEAIYASLASAGGLEHFEFFVLSDTTRDDVAAEERCYWTDFRRRMYAGNRVFYRRREKNIGRKAGNIADFCNRWGYRYDHMVVLDADSVMSGETLVTMVRLMEANPQAGLIQTQPITIRQQTLFGRALQFGSRLVGPMLSSGLSFWHMGESNYWGHNAIIRTAAFIAHCGLPTLPGKPPLGGEIYSHDFVEAALLRRGGWRVYFVPDLEGSYEEMPGNILDFATRDRLRCQGNLQHLKLLCASGLHPLSRFHLLQGAFSYLSSPLWAAFLMLSTADVVEQAITGHRYFTGCLPALSELADIQAHRNPLAVRGDHGDAVHAQGSCSRPGAARSHGATPFRRRTTCYPERARRDAVLDVDRPRYGWPAHLFRGVSSDWTGRRVESAEPDGPRADGGRSRAIPGFAVHDRYRLAAGSPRQCTELCLVGFAGADRPDSGCPHFRSVESPLRGRLASAARNIAHARGDVSVGRVAGSGQGAFARAACGRAIRTS